jgi:V/A-type H+/Na+-transporting ATPase subunit E
MEKIMAEELKHLIEQIQKEGVEKANQEAETIISQAKEKAAKMIKEADEKAQKILEKAKSEADAFAERSVKTLEQAARDLLITVGKGCEKVVTSVLETEVDAAFKGDLLEKLISNLIDQNKGADIQISLSDADKQALAVSCSAKLQSAGSSVELKSDSEVLSGFKIGFKNKSVYLDFTGEAVAEALASFLRPELARTVSNVAREQLSAKSSPEHA